MRYEVALCVNTGEIVWIFGGLPCGAYPDLKLAREAFVHGLDANERVFADRGYNDQSTFILPNAANSRFHNLVMSRHETVNKRIKQFVVLATKFRHNRSLHRNCFYAVGNLTQLVIKHEEPLFSVI